uniref:Uncharacterized protein n=1 Tax=Coccidioides posadasii RMSCC 3488 TaxID=454284 RepID=A0A0J6FLM9_COCPO|nr:hypothetical protein CPAG_07565 [Coccidioides posadasii RMSCC 3488]
MADHVPRVWGKSVERHRGEARNPHIPNRRAAAPATAPGLTSRRDQTNVTWRCGDCLDSQLRRCEHGLAAPFAAADWESWGESFECFHGPGDEVLSQKTPPSEVYFAETLEYTSEPQPWFAITLPLQGPVFSMRRLAFQPLLFSTDPHARLRLAQTPILFFTGYILCLFIVLIVQSGITELAISKNLGNNPTWEIRMPKQPSSPMGSAKQQTKEHSLLMRASRPSDCHFPPPCFQY